MDNEFENINNLTQFQLLAAEIGKEAANRISKLLAGQCIKIPKKLTGTTASYLIKTLGTKDAELLIQSSIPGERFYFPHILSRQQRTAMTLAYVAKRTAKGDSARDIAQTLKVSERCVRIYRAKSRDLAHSSQTMPNSFAVNAPLTVGSDGNRQNYSPTHQTATKRT